MVIASRRCVYLLAVLLLFLTVFPADVVRAAGTDSAALEWSGQVPDEWITGGDAVQFKVVAVDSASNKTDVTADAKWTSNNTGVAKVENGLVTPLSKGTARITAQWNGKTLSRNITVKARYTKLTLEPSGKLELLTGEQAKQLGVTGTLSSGKTEAVSGVSWSSSNTSVATVENGLVTPVAKGIAYIAARSEGLSTQITVYVRSSSQALLLSETGSLSMFLAGPSQKLKATDVSVSGAKTDVSDRAEWSSSAPLVLSVSEGVLTPKAAGKSTVKVVYNGNSKSVKVTVLPTIDRLVANKASVSVTVGSKASLPSISAYMADESRRNVTSDVTWSVGNTSVVKLEGSKLVASAPGKTNLTASVGGKQLQIPVTVQYKVVKLTVSQAKYTLTAGQEASLPTVKAQLSNGASMDISEEVSWVASNARVTLQNGKIKAVSKGTATVKAMYMGKYVKASVKVEPVLQSLSSSAANVGMNLKTSKGIKITGVYTDGTSTNLTQSMKWTTSNAAVATMKGSTIKAVGIGTTTLTGTYQDKSVQIQVTVSPKLKKLVISSKNVKLAPGASQVLTVTAQYDNGGSKNVAAEAIWVSTKAGVATVSGGTVQAVAKGSTTIKVSYGGKYVTAAVKVSG
ncbi:Ig-like domain-containing protein [Paenibacillus sp. P96]|uniref:Ig-like domain-containing protein n=1 Tax=Paenibacillus zeirhizosphaerae TaxID=2987519 RepID=A0ABT9FQ98_9BACL|nr:Ig-like domain-containing protein [Paenibacillus sp. P96]MDP4096900.1 Ig-like domain-containing protein [Paenibacillus sp. P96]